MIFRRHRRKVAIPEVDPDEIFLDSQNIPSFDSQQFEGRIESAIPKRTIVFLGSFFVFVGVIFIFKAGVLQIKMGEAYSLRSEQNSLDTLPLFSDRGIIFDRNGVELVTNKMIPDSDFPVRNYTDKQGFSHILGYVSYPAKDTSGVYWQKEIIGKDGIEKSMNSILSGKNGLKIFETDALGDIKSENLVNAPEHGENVNLAIDARLQNEFSESIERLADTAGFIGGAGVIMDVNTGEVIVMTSFPEYDSNILSLGSDRATISSYIHDNRKVFLNKTIGGLYTPGSIVKPFVAVGALMEGVIDPSKQILSTGSISLPNPYNPELKTIFNDWKAHGWVDMRKALAVSSNVYFYAISGGFGDQKGMGISNIKKYTQMFGLGKKTGIDMVGELTGTIPSPEWKEKNFPGDVWRVGDTYNTAIGQYGFQVTPIQMVRAVAAIANGGKLLNPTILKTDEPVGNIETINIPEDVLNIVREGMRMVVTEGSGTIMNYSGITVAAKTGTAQVGISKNYMNSWSMGFFPYENPRYAFIVLMEKGPKTNTIGASHVMKDVLSYINTYAPEYVE
ncbi:MAG: hypothetical protein KBD26_03350 [Candidatus Pacebacteria bacterium]|nr:hypothetical protein [Candidatus Paceibacterota bacterium]